jgi:uncharacterized membrane protein YfcA
MPETTLLIQMAVILLVTGAFAGVLAGLLGVGGGIILVPVFFYVFQRLGYGGDALMQICLATSLATILVTSLRSVLAHHKRGAVEWSVLRSWAPGIVIGALAGMLTVSLLRTNTLQVIFGLLALLVGLYMALGRDSWRLGPAMPTGLARAALSPLVGFLSVLMGIGGGAFGVSLMSLFGMTVHRAVATAAGFGVLIAVPAVAGFMIAPIDPAQQPPFSIGAVNLAAFALVIAMTLLTAPLGARMAHAMNPKPLKRVFAVFLMLVALNMLRKVWVG